MLLLNAAQDNENCNKKLCHKTASSSQALLTELTEKIKILFDTYGGATDCNNYRLISTLASR